MHLLKARSKPVMSGRKRKKVETLGTYAQYKESKSKAQTMAPGPMLTQPPQIHNAEAQENNAGSLSSIFAKANAKTKKAGKMTDE